MQTAALFGSAHRSPTGDDHMLTNWTHLLFSTLNNNFQLFLWPWWYGFLNTCVQTEDEALMCSVWHWYYSCVYTRRSRQCLRTLPFSCNLLVSLLLMWRSTLVSPLVMSSECHRVSPPRATVTELQGRTHHNMMIPTFMSFLITGGWISVPHLVSTQRKMTLLWAVVSLEVLGGGVFW